MKEKIEQMIKRMYSFTNESLLLDEQDIDTIRSIIIEESSNRAERLCICSVCKKRYLLLMLITRYPNESSVFLHKKYCEEINNIGYQSFWERLRVLEKKRIIESKQLKRYNQKIWCIK